MDELWDLWIPEVGATGLSFARSRVDAGVANDRVLVHAAPPVLDVTVRGEDGSIRAEGRKLERGEPGPMSYLVRRDNRIILEDGWPDERDLGRVVILPGGEAGILREWWHAEDRSSWRWQVQFSNHV
jgi:D-alanyl-D-alanine dipeptidase